MRETTTRILVAIGMAAIAVGAAVGEYYGVPLVRWLMVAIVIGMAAECILCAARGMKNKDAGIRKFAKRSIFGLVPWFILLIAAAYRVGAHPMIVLLLLLVISGADIGAFAFGRIIGGDKMWPNVSPGKTWSGQIAGIACGTLAGILFGFIGSAIAGGHIDYGQFMPQFMWVGISVALMSQYGDLAASAFKRKLGVKDYSHILPGHGGLMDRFDGWLFVLPIVWLVMI